MGACPDVDEDQAPEVQYGQPIGEHRPVGRLGHEVVHDAEERGGEQEADRVVAVPPLHEGVLHPGVNGVAVEQARRHGQVVEHVQQGDGDKGRYVEPDGDVEVTLTTAGDGAEDVDAEDYPHHGDGDVDGPLQLGVLLALGNTRGKAHRCGDDDRLPAPEVQLRQRLGEHARLEQPLQRVVDAGEDGVAREGEDDRVGVQGPQATEGQPGQAEVEGRRRQLQGDQEPHDHAHQPPHQGDEDEAADDGVVIAELLEAGGHSVRSPLAVVVSPSPAPTPTPTRCCDFRARCVRALAKRTRLPGLVSHGSRASIG